MEYVVAPRALRTSACKTLVSWQLGQCSTFQPLMRVLALIKGVFPQTGVADRGRQAGTTLRSSSRARADEGKVFNLVRGLQKETGVMVCHEVKPSLYAVGIAFLLLRICMTLDGVLVDVNLLLTFPTCWTSKVAHAINA